MFVRIGHIGHPLWCQCKTETLAYHEKQSNFIKMVFDVGRAPQNVLQSQSVREQFVCKEKKQNTNDQLRHTCTKSHLFV